MKKGGKRKTPQNCKSPIQRQRFITTLKSVTEKKTLKTLIRFHGANKMDNYNRGEKRKEKSKRIHRTSQNIRIMQVFLESLLSGSFPSLGVTVHLTSRGCPPTLLISGPALGAAQILMWTPVCSRLHCPQPSEPVRFLLWALSAASHISMDTESPQLILWI